MAKRIILVQPTEQNTTIPTRRRDRLRLLRQYPGMLAAVSRRHRVKISHVSKVFHKQVVSARVTEAIRREIERRQAAAVEAPEKNKRQVSTDAA